MFKKDESKRKFAMISKDIEDQLDKTLTDKRQEIESNLEERIKLMKQEADRKIDQSREEIYQEKKELKHYLGVVADLENSTEEIRVKINQHAEHVARFKNEILKMADTHIGELQSMKDLNQKLTRLQQDANDRAKAITRQLNVKFGIDAKLPEIDVFKDAAKLDASNELERVARLKDLMLAIEVPATAEEPAEAEKASEAGSRPPDVKAIELGPEHDIPTLKRDDLESMMKM